MPHIGMPELFVILALMLLVFGPRKLPEIARGFGQGIKEFKQAMRDTFSSEEAPGPVRESAASSLNGAEERDSAAPGRSSAGA